MDNYSGKLKADFANTLCEGALLPELEEMLNEYRVRHGITEEPLRAYQEMIARTEEDMKQKILKYTCEQEAAKGEII